MKNYSLYEIEQIKLHQDKSLKNYPPLPVPDQALTEEHDNKLIMEELSFDIHVLAEEARQVYVNLNSEQKDVYNVVITSVDGRKGGLYFVNGEGETGNKYLYKAILARLRSEEKIALAIALSSIASLLLPGGGLLTIDSQFQYM